MSKRVGEHPALAVGNGEQQRLVLVGAAGGLGREGGGQHGQVLGRTTEPAVQFVGHVHEGLGQALGDRVVRLADDQLERLHRSVAAALARLRVANDLSVAPADVRAGLLVAAAPAAQPRHFVVLLPLGKRRASEVVDHQPAAALDVIDQGLLGFFRPRVALIVAHHHVIRGKVRLEAAHVLAPRGRSGHVHRKQAALFQDFLEHGRGGLPFVAVLAVDDQGLKRRFCQCDGSQHRPDSQRPQTVFVRHSIVPPVSEPET